MKKLLLTGAGGFLNSRLYEFYRGKFDILPLGSRDMDITNREDVIRRFREFKPNYVIHAAAISSTEGCRDNEDLAYRVNTEGCANVAEASKVTGAKLIYCSTEQIFNGNLERGPYTEQTLPCPDTVYGRTKYEGEGRIAEIYDNTVIIRLTWLFGLPERGRKVNHNILWNVIKAILKNEPIKVPDGEYRGHTYVYELIENMEKILELPPGIYHAGSMNNESTYDVAAHIMKVMGIGNRINELLIRDSEKYRLRERDIRIDNNKIASYGVVFHSTLDALERAVGEYGYKLYGLSSIK